MKDLRQYIYHLVNHSIPQLTEKIHHISREDGRKLMQYLMMCVLLFLCFILPRAGAERSVQESTGQQNIRGTAQTEEMDTGQTVQENSGTIVLDPGHGGDDPGMIGSSGINEKVLNLVYAKKVKALLEEQGYRVVMTRETEDGLYDAHESNKKAQDMQRRVAIIAETKPLLTVSIHQNCYPDPSVSGPQVFYFEHSVEGERLAACIQEAMNTELNIARPRVHKGNTSYYILKRSGSVTVIVECGFLSCPQEEAKLQEETYQDQVARAICDGIMNYIEHK